jgi:hypothetical protein
LCHADVTRRPADGVREAMERTDAELLIASRDDPRAFRELYDR